MCEICSVLMNIARAFALAAPCFNMTWRSTTTSSSTPGSRSRAARTAAATRSCSYGAGYPGLSKAGYGIEVDFGGTWEWVNNLVVDTLGVPFTSTHLHCFRFKTLPVRGGARAYRGARRT